MKNNYSKILNIIVSVGIVLTLITLSALPFILGAYSKNAAINLESKYVTTITMGIYICAIPYVVALVSSKLFEMTIDIKDENDRTI